LLQLERSPDPPALGGKDRVVLFFGNTKANERLTVIKQTASLGTGTTVRFSDYTPSSTSLTSTPILTTASPALASSITTPGSASTAAPSQGEGYRYMEMSSTLLMLGLWSASLFIVAHVNMVV
jgi:hypothetical protein